jgi:type II secretory pathway component PulC
MTEILSDDGNFAVKLDQLKQATDDVVSNLWQILQQMKKAKVAKRADGKEMRILEDARRKDNIFNFQLEDL